MPGQVMGGAWWLGKRRGCCWETISGGVAGAIERDVIGKSSVVRSWGEGNGYRWEVVRDGGWGEKGRLMSSWWGVTGRRSREYAPEK